MVGCGVGSAVVGLSDTGLLEGLLVLGFFVLGVGRGVTGASVGASVILITPP